MSCCITPDVVYLLILALCVTNVCELSTFDHFTQEIHLQTMSPWFHDWWFKLEFKQSLKIPKEVIRNSKSEKDGQCNDRKKRDKGKHNKMSCTTQTTKDWATLSTKKTQKNTKNKQTKKQNNNSNNKQTGMSSCAPKVWQPPWMLIMVARLF